jgi:hypothetical protein
METEIDSWSLGIRNASKHLRKSVGVVLRLGGLLDLRYHALEGTPTKALASIQVDRTVTRMYGQTLTHNCFPDM